MYVCIYTTTGASYPPHPMGGVGTRDTGPYIYSIYYIIILDPRIKPISCYGFSCLASVAGDLVTGWWLNGLKLPGLRQ